MAYKMVDFQHLVCHERCGGVDSHKNWMVPITLNMDGP